MKRFSIVPLSLFIVFGCVTEEPNPEPTFVMPVAKTRSKQEEVALRNRLKKATNAAFSNRQIERKGQEQAKQLGPLLQNSDLPPLPEGLMLLYEATLPSQESSIRFEITLNGTTAFEKRDLMGETIERRSERLSTPEVQKLHEAMTKCGLCDLNSALYKPQYDAGVVAVRMHLAEICGVTMWSNEWLGRGKECHDFLKGLLDKGK